MALLNTTDASEYLKREHGVVVAPATLTTWRCTGTTPLPFRRVAGRVYYAVADLDRLAAGELTPKPQRPGASVR